MQSAGEPRDQKARHKAEIERDRNRGESVGEHTIVVWKAGGQGHFTKQLLEKVFFCKQEFDL